HPSNGVMRTFWYAQRLVSGATNASITPQLAVDAGAIAVVDGQHGIGQQVAGFATEQAISRARQHGVGMVSVRHSGHFGTAMYFTRQIADNGCIGFIATNASLAMAPWGGKEKLIGTNPWSIGAPAGKYAPMLLDIANTAVARGKLHVAASRGEAIAPGWAVDSNGNPTTNPIEGIAGNILPMAGHKGYGISVMMDVLSGVLGGSGFANDVVGPYEPEGSSGVHHMIMALNINAFRSMDDFLHDMETYIEKIKATPCAAGHNEIYYPGEPEAIAEAKHLQQGITLPDSTVQELNTDALKLGVATL
ncbi:MAG: Ldh family oxidoreductase, partial [Pseudomonadota bacterium]